MKKLVLLLCTVLLLTGCAGKKPHPVSIGLKAFGSEGFSVIDIPSHGLIGDGLSLALGGGSYVSSVRNNLLEIQEKPLLKQVLVTSNNSLLAKTILANALDGLERGSLDTVHLIFAGKKGHGDDLRESAELTGARYESIVR